MRGFFIWVGVHGGQRTLSHSQPMDLQALVHLLQARLPGLMAVYAFGSRVREKGLHARTESDLDLAVLVEAYADPVALFELSGSLSDLAACPVDLLDLRAASTVMQHQILMQGERCVARAHDEYSADLEGFAKNFTRQDAAILNIPRACEAALDMGRHIHLTGFEGLYPFSIPKKARQDTSSGSSIPLFL